MNHISSCTTHSPIHKRADPPLASCQNHSTTADAKSTISSGGSPVPAVQVRVRKQACSCALYNSPLPSAGAVEPIPALLLLLQALSPLIALSSHQPTRPQHRHTHWSYSACMLARSLTSFFTTRIPMIFSTTGPSVSATS